MRASDHRVICAPVALHFQVALLDVAFFAASGFTEPTTYMLLPIFTISSSDFGRTADRRPPACKFVRG
jgi:hypothetical protein